MGASREVTERIAELEWTMFTAVNEGGPRASCQDDRVTFTGMRIAQFSAWSQDAAEAYLDDLTQAARSGRNLIAEKYIHMMKTTEPSKYELLLKTIPNPDGDTRERAKAVSDRLLAQTCELFETYPYVSGEGRPLYSAYDYAGVVSVETYQLGELLTYSAKTLTALMSHIEALEASGVSLARSILENTVSFYGYASLDAAEAKTKERIDAIGIQVSYGCEDCAV